MTPGDGEFRRFYVMRSIEDTTANGENVMGEGVLFSDGSVVVNMRSRAPETYPSMAAVREHLGGARGKDIMLLDGPFSEVTEP